MNLFLELEKEFLNIEEIFNKEYLKQFMCCKYDNIYLYHFGLGTWIRNNILIKESEIYKIFTASGITHTDDMSGILIRLLYIYLKTKDKNHNLIYD